MKGTAEGRSLTWRATEFLRLPDDGLDRLWSAAGLQPGARVIDIGAGTERVAIPLAGRGCDVVAVEPAHGMVDRLRALDAERTVLDRLLPPCNTANAAAAVQYANGDNTPRGDSALLICDVAAPPRFVHFRA